MATAFSYPSDMLSMLMLVPVVPALEPLPLEDLSPPPPRSGAYRRHCTAGLAMLLAGNIGVKEYDEHELRCRYPSKLCRNSRVRKASGALHRYCAYHRDKANANQKRWVGRQRGDRTSSTTSSSPSPCSSTSSSAGSSPSSAKTRWMAAASFEEPTASAATLSDDEWDALLSLLNTPGAPSMTKTPVPPRSRRRRRGSGAPRRHDSPLE